MTNQKRPNSYQIKKSCLANKMNGVSKVLLVLSAFILVLFIINAQFPRQDLYEFESFTVPVAEQKEFKKLGLKTIRTVPELKEYRRFGQLVFYWTGVTRWNQPCTRSMIGPATPLYGDFCEEGEEMDWIEVGFSFNYADKNWPFFYLYRRILFLPVTKHLRLFFNKADKRFMFAVEKIHDPRNLY